MIIIYLFINKETALNFQHTYIQFPISLFEQLTMFIFIVVRSVYRQWNNRYLSMLSAAASTVPQHIVLKKDYTKELF